MSRHETSLSYAARIERVMRHIADHLDDGLDLNHLAGIACFSPFHFHRLFVAMTGETVAEAVRRLRLHRAAVELNRSAMPLPRVARKAGYGSVAAFTRAFASAYGAPPDAYRRSGHDLRPAPHTIGANTMNSRPTFKTELSYDVTIETVPAFTLAGLSHRGDYQEIGKTFDRLFAWAGGLNLLGATTRSVGVYYDDPASKPLKELRSEAGITVPTGTQLGSDMHWLDVEGGRVARLLHKGPYADLDVAYSWLYHSWLPASGQAVGESPCFEEYLNNPREVAPSEWLTAVNLPLRG